MINDNPAPSVTGQRLLEARKSSGRTQEEAAEFLGCSRPTFIAIEKGTRQATSDEIVKLAALYGRSVHEIVRPGAPSIALEPHLRAVVDRGRTDSEDLQRAIQEFQGLADDYVELERLLNAKPIELFPNECRLPPFSGIREIRILAENLAVRERARLFLGDQPILNLRRVLEIEVGVRIFFGDLPSAIAGMYAFVADARYCIMVNRKHPIERCRATMAHEYGHFLCDRHKPGIDYLAEPAKKSWNERFVEAFSMSFLMPETSVRRQFLEIRESAGDFQVADLCRMSSFYVVSVQAMALRLEALGLIEEGTWDFLRESKFQIAAARKSLKLQPTGQSESMEPYPIRYKFLAIQAYEKELISEGQLARFLRCDRVTARAILEECVTRNDDVDVLGHESEVTLPFQQSLLKHG